MMSFHICVLIHISTVIFYVFVLYAHLRIDYLCILEERAMVRYEKKNESFNTTVNVSRFVFLLLLDMERCVCVAE